MCVEVAGTLVVEAVDPVDGCALVVPSEQEEILWVLYFEGEEQADRLEAEFPSVDVISEEEVIRLWREPAVLK